MSSSAHVVGSRPSGIDVSYEDDVVSEPEEETIIDVTPVSAVLAQAWQKVSNYLTPRDINVSAKRSRHETPDLVAAIKVVKQGGLVETIFVDFLHEVSSNFHLVERDIKRYITQMNEARTLSLTPDLQVVVLFREMLERVGMWYKIWGVGVKLLDEPELRTLNATYNNHFQLLLHTSLAILPFFPYLKTYFASTLNTYNPTTNTFHPPSPTIYRLGFLPRYSDLLVQIAFREIERFVINVGADNYQMEESEGNVSVGVGTNALAGPSNSRSTTVGVDTKTPSPKSLGKQPMTSDGDDHTEPLDVEDTIMEAEDPGPWGTSKLDELMKVVEQRVLGWVLSYTTPYETAFQPKKGIESRLEVKLVNEFFELRASELFDIIVDFPKSAPALEDLRKAVQKTGRRAELVKALKADQRRRLLHPGAETKSIIQIYVNTIKCMRVLDPQGVLLHQVANPIHANLRLRSDTVKCIVTSIVDNEFDEDQEADQIKPLQVRDEQAEDFCDAQWEPEPVDAAPEFRHRKASDIISTLVGIFDSRELVVKEIQNLLATRLMAVKDYDASHEIRLVELLKLRFGDAPLQVCQVMLKDMADSKRTDTHVQGEKESALHPVIISRLYWPTMTNTAIKLPKRLKKMQKAYQQQFHRFKPDKYLKFLLHLGTVGIKLELENRTLDVDATPLQAAVLECFFQPRWHFTELADKLQGVEATFLRHALNFWVNHGVLREDLNGNYELLEKAEDVAGEGAELLDTEELPVMQPAVERTAEMEEFSWGIIRDIISASGPQTTAQLRASLEASYGWDHSEVELERFLHGVRREGLAEMDSTATKWQLVDLGSMGVL